MLERIGQRKESRIRELEPSSQPSIQDSGPFCPDLSLTSYEPTCLSYLSYFQPSPVNREIGGVFFRSSGWNPEIYVYHLSPDLLDLTYCSSVIQSCLTLCNLVDCSTTGFPVLHHLLEPAQTQVHWVGDAIQPSHPLWSPSPPALIFPSIRVFSNESALHIRWPKYWSFSFNICPSNEHPGLISFKMNWLDLLAVQGTLKSLLQHQSSKPSILLHSAFFIVQISHPYMTTGKTKALTRQTFVSKVMSLLLNKLSRLVITFLSRSKWLLISWLQSPSAVILEPPKVSFVFLSLL